MIPMLHFSGLLTAPSSETELAYLLPPSCFSGRSIFLNLVRLLLPSGFSSFREVSDAPAGSVWVVTTGEPELMVIDFVVVECEVW